MDNPNSKKDENKWVEDRIASLSTPAGWRPNADQALERVMQQRSTPASRALRLSMAGVTLAAIGVVLTVLPWHVLWTPNTGEPTVSAPQPNFLTGPAQSSSAPPQVDTTAKPAPPQEVSPQVAPAAKVEASTPQLNPGVVVTVPEIPGFRPQELPRIFAAQPETSPKAPARGQEPVQWRVPPPGYSEAVAQASAQGQQPAPPPSNVTAPVLVSQVQPAYTPEARDARVQGTIEIQVLVRDDGTVKVDKIRRGLGYGLDEAAIAAVEQWKFIPGKKDGKPVAVFTSILVNFSLK